MLKIQSRKKGNLNMLAMSILILMIAGACLFFGITISDKLKDATDNYLNTVINESGYVNGTGDVFNRYTDTGFNSPYIIEIRNSSNTVIASANYTISGSTLYNTTSQTFAPVNISYGYYYGQSAYSSSNKSIAGLGTFADFWSIIVLAVVITIVVGLLLMILSTKKVR